MSTRAAVAEAAWLARNPDFIERPATLTEFLGPEYLNIEKGVRAPIRETLADIIGHKVTGKRITAFPKAMITGGIGIGKTTIASIVLPYLCHWTLCLKQPQEFFDLLPGSRIAFMQMSTNESQAKEVVFGDIQARIKYSPWFKRHPIDPNFKNQIRFDGDIWILPGDSAETSFEGYNILGGIIDEADSHKVTEAKDYARVGYDTIHGRITSRFQDRGFILVIGQMKKSDGFASQIYKEFSEDDQAYTKRLAIWESFGWEKFQKPDPLNKRKTINDSFWYDAKRKIIVPDIAGLVADKDETEQYIEVPTIYRRDFENNPEKALKDLAGIPPAVGDPFISLTYKIEEAQERWIERYGGIETFMLPDGKLDRAFEARDSIKRVVHIDLAYSARGDALGFVMGHIPEMVDIDGELKPRIVIDLMYRIKALPGSEIMFSQVRHFLYALRDDLKFRVKKVTMDGFQSQDTVQQLRKRRFEVEKVSVDKQLLPYHDLRDALYEDRIDLPKYMVYVNHGDRETVNIAYKELASLTDNGKMVDHPPQGSKDVADGLAGVTYTLMGDRRFRRGRGSSRSGEGSRMPETPDLGGLWAPVPPNAGDLNPFFGSLLGPVAPIPRPDASRSMPTGDTTWDGPARTR